jgi:hypothetical protein
MPAEPALCVGLVVERRLVDDGLCVLAGALTRGAQGADHHAEPVNITWSDAAQMLLPDQGSGLATASGFETNRVQFRCEGRSGLELRRPWSFVEVAMS